MADRTLNNNDIVTLLTGAYEMATGQDGIDTLDLSDFVDGGSAYETLIQDNAWRDQFTKALLVQCVKNFYMDSSYAEEYRNPFYQDARTFGAITQLITIEAPEVQESHSWQNFVSGTSKAGEYTLFLPNVTTAYAGKSTSWELPVAVTDEQWNPAFKNKEELATFVAQILMVVRNAIIKHQEDIDGMNRNNFIATKIAYAGSVGAEGIHVVDLVALYRAETGDTTITTKEDFMADDKCMRFAAETFDKYMNYMTKQSALFNIGGKVKFCPKSRMVCQVLQHFESRMRSVSYADTYNMEFVKLPLHDTVPYWQGFGYPSATTGAIDFDEISAVNVKTAGGDTVNQTGVVAFMADQWSVMSCLQSERTAVTRFDPEAVTQYYYQFKSQQINNAGQNALVFVLNDVT